MNRKEFLITVWEKGIQPILLIGIIFFCLKFLFTVFTESGTERFVTILIIVFGLIMLTISLIGQLFKSFTEKLYSKLPESVILWLRIVEKFLDFVAPLLLGALIYHFWKEDWMSAAIVVGVLMVQRILDIIKEEKRATIQNKPH